MVSISWLCLLAGCHTTQTVSVSSKPRGATILVDGEDSGLKTPAQLTLSSSETTYTISIAKPGYNTVSRTVDWQTDVEAIKPGEAAGAILCAPCCLGLPLLRFLEPIKVKNRFVPDKIRAELDPEGQGLKLSVDQEGAEVYVNGTLRKPLEKNTYLLEVGDHQLEVRCEGFRTYRRRIYLQDNVYQSLEIELDIGGQGFLLSAKPEGGSIYLDDKLVGILEKSPKRIQTSPGDRELRVELEGYRVWKNVIEVRPEAYEKVDVRLRLSGQGLIVHKPQGTRSRDRDIRILVDDELHETSFEKPLRLDPGRHEVIVDVKGYWPWRQVVRVNPDAYLELEPELKKKK